MVVFNEFFKEVFDLRGVINYIGKLCIKEYFFELWEFLMGEIVIYLKIYCKIFGMVIEVDYDNWDVEYFKLYIE